MLYICEFEFFESDGFIDAIPCNDMGAGTFGSNLKDAVESAADWLKEIVDDALINGNELPETTVGHKPTHNGKIIAVAVSRELGDIPSMTAADAARELNVSTARISQLINAGLLDSWKEGTKRLVSKASVEARKDEMPKAGRPKKTATAEELDRMFDEGADMSEYMDLEHVEYLHQKD